LNRKTIENIIGGKKMEFFSDSELGRKQLITEDISLSVYNTIMVIFNKYELYFCEKFPLKNDKNNITGTDRKTLVTTIRGYIPSLEKLGTLDEWDDIPDKYSVLDFVQLCFSIITDIEYNDTDFWGRDTYISLNLGVKKESFRQEINQLFERNQIVFYLDKDGKVKRNLPLEMDNLVNNLPIKTNDHELNNFIKLAIENIHKPKLSDRKFALEKIWDAYERMKTFYGLEKKNSAKQLVQNVAAGTDNFDTFLNSEFKTLTDIGNDFQIRHFEKGTFPINEVKHIDYLFYKMIALISLCLTELNGAD